MRQDRTLAAVVERLENRWLLSTVTWNGGGNGTNWSDPLNWDGNILPGAADDVTINFVTNTIVHDSGTDTVNNLTTNHLWEPAGGTLSVVTTTQVINMWNSICGIRCRIRARCVCDSCGIERHELHETSLRSLTKHETFTKG